ncbi:MAG: type II toxin-antitoxin system mRNA interferase toxin, RelE/StbE family [Patescibacteria group bacterium]
MEIRLHKSFTKNYRKRILHDKKLDLAFEKRLTLFKQNSKNLLLKDHKLTGSMKEYRAFWITGDVRVVYKIENNLIRLYDIGSHNQVYRN